MQRSGIRETKQRFVSEHLTTVRTESRLWIRRTPRISLRCIRATCCDTKFPFPQSDCLDNFLCFVSPCWASSFFCLPKRRNQEKGTPEYGAGLTAGSLRCSVSNGRCATHHLLQCNKWLRQCSRCFRYCPALLGASQGEADQNNRPPPPATPILLYRRLTCYRLVTVCRVPFGDAEKRRAPAEKARALSEAPSRTAANAELRSARWRSSIAGDPPLGGRRNRVPFFLATSFWASKKK